MTDKIHVLPLPPITERNSFPDTRPLPDNVISLENYKTEIGYDFLKHCAVHSDNYELLLNLMYCKVSYIRYLAIQNQHTPFEAIQTIATQDKDLLVRLKATSILENQNYDKCGNQNY